MNSTVSALLFVLVVGGVSLSSAEPIRGKVSLPATGIPGEGPCGPISDVTEQAVRSAAARISESTRGTVPQNVLTSLIINSGLVRAEHSACQQVCIVTPGTYNIWFESTRSSNHPWFCTGHRPFIDFNWSRVQHINSRSVGAGYYLICGTFQNWSHDQALDASIVAYPPGEGWLWPAWCGQPSSNTPSAAHAN
jgi:hypothetical protein